MKCKQCRKSSGKNKFCCVQCKTTWHNRNRTLEPNVFYDCEVCGKPVARYISPFRQTAGTMRFCGRTCAGKWRSGGNHPMWTGGRVFDKDGYILIASPGHKRANARGYVLEHRIKMEKKLGRILTEQEVVHHKNGNIQDNRISNLMLFASNGEHKQHENQQSGVKRNGRGQYVKRR